MAAPLSCSFSFDELSLAYQYSVLGLAEQSSLHQDNAPPIRVLMLHGYNNDGSSFENLLKALRRKFGSRFELCFAQAPHVLPETSVVVLDGYEVELQNHSKGDAARAWFYYFEEDKAKLPQDFHDPNATRPYFGWEQSVLALEQLWQERGPFDAVFGFSQGATATMKLCALAAGY